MGLESLDGPGQGSSVQPKGLIELGNGYIFSRAWHFLASLDPPLDTLTILPSQQGIPADRRGGWRSQDGPRFTGAMPGLGVD
jgi:hypothetical protein